MLRSQRKEQLGITPTPPITAEDDSPDRRTLLYLLSFVLAGVEGIRSTQMTPTPTPTEWLERWDDDEYTYLEARIPGDDSELELDLNVDNGVIFARIRRSTRGLGCRGRPNPPRAPGAGGRGACVTWRLGPGAGRLADCVGRA